MKIVGFYEVFNPKSQLQKDIFYILTIIIIYKDIKNRKLNHKFIFFIGNKNILFKELYKSS